VNRRATVRVRPRRRKSKYPTAKELGLRPGSIEYRIVELSRQVPDEEWEKLPRDGSYNHDPYLYGAPKKPVPEKSGH
jgi:hypothetical protein